MPRILTVDDSATIRSIISKNLSDLGFEIDHAEDGQIALAKLEKITVDLILLDVTMPVMDGPMMLEKLRATGNKTPVIMLTSESKRTIVSGAVKLGIEDYILKPFKPEELRAKVLKVLRMDGVGRVGSPSLPPPNGPLIDVLVIDDMENVHKKFRSLLPEAMTMNACVGARDALQNCQEHAYRVILIDLVIPDVNSVALMKQLRVLQPQAVMVALALRTASDIASQAKSQGFQDVMLKPFDSGAIDEWRVKYFAVESLLSVDDNVLSIAEFVGKQDRLDSYYARLKSLCRASFELLASGCFEDSIVDLSKVPMHNDKLPRLVLDMDAEARKFGIALRLVGSAETKKALSVLVETASLPFFATLSEAKAA